MINLQNQNTQMGLSRTVFADYKKECEHLQKRIIRKNEQIEILKQTVKTLFSDNQKIVRQKQQMNKQVIVLRQQIGVLKKKIKKQQDEMSNHKIELQKLSNLAEQRLNEYLKQDQEKQMKIKKLQSQNQKYKNEINKKERVINNYLKKSDEFKLIES